MQVFRNAQGYTLSSTSTPIAAAAQGSVIGTAQIPLALEEVIVTGGAADGGLITGIAVAGQQVTVSNQPFPWMCLSHRLDGMYGGFRSLGLTISQSQTVQIDVNNNGAAPGEFQFAITTTPISEDAVVPTSASCDALNYIAGLGEVAIAAGATAQLTCTILRPTVLGRLVLVQQGAVDPGGTLAGVTVDSILVNNIELLSGQTGAAAGAGIPAQACSVLSTFTAETNQLAYPVEINSQITLNLSNRNAAGVATVGGAIFCLPR